MAKRVQAEQQRTIQHRAGGQIRVGIEIVFDPVSKEKFISKHLLCAIKNRLARHETLSGHGERLRARLRARVRYRVRNRFRDKGRLWTVAGFHPFCIGLAAENFRLNLQEYARPLVMAQRWKTNGFPPLRTGRFVSNIKMFSTAMLPGWPFAPNRLQAPIQLNIVLE